MALYRVSLKHHTPRPTQATAAQHAAYLLRDVETPATKAYVEYVLRQSRTTQDREDLAHAEWHHLPAFAANNPVTFFAACDQYEGANRRVSSTLEVALPRELSREAQRTLMQDYCASQFPRQPYLVALHDSRGASGEHNPHFHVTFSARIHDGVERSADAFFRRPPHGAGKDPIFLEQGWLTATRQAWSDLANVALEREGIDYAYVDPRRLLDRGILRAPEERLAPDHSTQAKLGKGITPAWQAVLDGRQARTATRGDEQAQAQRYWTQRKQQLGITDVHTLDRAGFVQQIARQTRDQALHPGNRPSIEQLHSQVHTLTTETQALETHADRVHAAVMIAEHRASTGQQPSGREVLRQHALLAQGAALGLGGLDDAAPGQGVRVRLARGTGKGEGYGW